MKKIYYKPQIEIMNFVTCNILQVSIYGEANTTDDNDKWANEYDTSESRGSWDDIWANM